MEDRGEHGLGACIGRFLGRVDVEGDIEGQGVGREFGGTEIFLLHAEMSFAGGEGLGKVLGDEQGGEAGPGRIVAALDSA